MSEKSKIPVNIKSMYKDLLADDPIKIISLIRDDLDDLVEKIISLDSDAVHIVGRKSNLLFKNFTDQISRTKPVLIVDSLKDIFVSYSHPGNVFLVVDAIHKGDEVSRFCKILFKQRNPPKVSKVFCYIAHIEGLNKIDDLGLETVCKFTCNTDQEYAETVKKLQVYYQAQIHPIETDIIYDMYTIKMSNRKLMLQMIRNSLSEMFDKKIRLKNNKIHAPDYIKQYSYVSNELLPNFSVIQKISIFKNIKNIKKVVIIIIVKIQFEKDKILMTFKNDALIEFSTNQNIKTKEKCKFNYVDIKKCPHNLIKFDKRKSILKNVICANCVGNEINEVILNLFKKILLNHLSNENIEYSVKRIGNWLNTYE